jgi:hypothetical protein
MKSRALNYHGDADLITTIISNQRECKLWQAAKHVKLYLACIELTLKRTTTARW